MRSKKKVPKKNQGSSSLSKSASRRAQHQNLSLTSELYTELRILESSKGLIDHTKRGEILCKIGRIQCSEGDVPGSLESLNEAMEIYRGLHGDEDILIANTLQDIGDVYFKDNKLSLAVDNYMDALKMTRTIQGNGDEYKIDIARLLVKVGNIAYEQHDLEVALPSFLLALKTFNSSPDCVKEHVDILERIGKLYYYDRSQYEEAISFYQKALVARKNIIGEHKSNGILSLEEEIAIINTKLGKIGKSISSLKSIVKEKEALCGKRSVEVATTLVALSNAYEKKGDYDRSMELLLRALSIQKEFLPNNADGNIALGITLNNIGNIHKLKQEMIHAMSAYTDALEIKEKCKGKHRHAKKEIAYTLVSIGIIHKLNNNLDEALQLFEEARTSQEKVLYANHLDLARTLCHEAIVFDKLHRFEDAMENHLEALRIYKEVHGPDHPGICQILCHIGAIHREWKDYKEALNVLNEGQRMIEADTKGKPEKMSLILANTIFEKGLVYQEMGEEREAINLYKLSLDKYRASGVNGNHTGVKRVLSTLSKIDNSFGTWFDTALSWAGFLAPDMKCTDGNAAMDAMSYLTSDLWASCNTEDNVSTGSRKGEVDLALVEQNK